jgi:hypothetical protein
MTQEARGIEQVKISVKNAYRVALEESVINPERRIA